MDKQQLKLIQRCWSTLVLLGVVCGTLPAQSTISGTLYDNAICVDPLVIGACSSPAVANIGGITINNSVIRGSLGATTALLLMAEGLMLRAGFPVLRVHFDVAEESGKRVHA